jgi:hypothetical protein
MTGAEQAVDPHGCEPDGHCMLGPSAAKDSRTAVTLSPLWRYTAQATIHGRSKSDLVYTPFFTDGPDEVPVDIVRV